ncbi:hypothetical protein J6590_083938 [Homalodisca vitripennis]|nr:hypothetical protein J6590_083938 [Homalodisca vitripennis]
MGLVITDPSNDSEFPSMASCPNFILDGYGCGWRPPPVNFQEKRFWEFLSCLLGRRDGQLCTSLFTQSRQRVSRLATTLNPQGAPPIPTVISRSRLDLSIYPCTPIYRYLRLVMYLSCTSIRKVPPIEIVERGSGSHQCRGRQRAARKNRIGQTSCTLEQDRAYELHARTGSGRRAARKNRIGQARCSQEQDRAGELLARTGSGRRAYRRNRIGQASYLQEQDRAGELLARTGSGRRATCKNRITHRFSIQAAAMLCFATF